MTPKQLLDSGDDTGIETTPDVCGGYPCIAGTRIPVWLLEGYRRLGTTEAKILVAYPSLRATDLVNAWNYVAEHGPEIDRQIRENEDPEQVTAFYADENFPLPTVVELRRLGHKVLTAEEAGQAGVKIPDDRVLAFAYSLGRVLLTMNRKHFRHLHQSGSPHSGIVICTHDNNFEALAARIDAKVVIAGNLAGQLLSVTRPPPA